MPDRRALIIGSWLAKGRNRPSSQRIRGLADRWTRIFEADRFGFRALGNPAEMPIPLLNPRRAQIVEHLDEARQIGLETELLLYFVGHSVSAGEHDLSLILGIGEDGADKMVLLSTLLGDVRNAGIRRVICILDTCHAGRTRTTFEPLRDQAFAMFATGDAYAFEAEFSDALLRAFEQPIRKNDQRIDRRAGGVTYKKLFQEARRRVLQAEDPPGAAREPTWFGDLGDEVVEPAPSVISDEYNAFASSRTIYGRIFILLELLRHQARSAAELTAAAQANPAFILRNGENGRRAWVSGDRISEYVDFLRAVRWLAQPGGQLTLTAQGRAAADRARFNGDLLLAIERYVLPEGMGLAHLDNVVRELLDDMIPPTPVRIKDRAAMLGHTLRLRPETRVALSLLPTTGRYLKGSSDAIFPAEPG